MSAEALQSGSKGSVIKKHMGGARRYVEKKKRFGKGSEQYLKSSQKVPADRPKGARKVPQKCQNSPSKMAGKSPEGVGERRSKVSPNVWNTLGCAVGLSENCPQGVRNGGETCLFYFFLTQRRAAPIQLHSESICTKPCMYISGMYINRLKGIG